jgi:hypothetical protein
LIKVKKPQKFVPKPSDALPILRPAIYRIEDLLKRLGKSDPEARPPARDD